MRRMNPIAEALIIIIIGLFMAVGLSIGYTAKTRADDNKQLCELTRVFDTPAPIPSGAAKPLGEHEKQQVDAVHRFRLEKCGGKQ